MFKLADTFHFKDISLKLNITDKKDDFIILNSQAIQFIVVIRIYYKNKTIVIFCKLHVHHIFIWLKWE